MRVDDLLGERQAEPRPAFLGGEEGNENLVLDFTRDPRTVVADLGQD